MNESLNNRQGIEQHLEAVNGYLLSALQTVAIELGDEDLAKKVTLDEASDSSLPYTDSLKILASLDSDSTSFVLVRMAEIQQEAHDRELKEIRRPFLRKYGKAILDGFTGFDIFGSQKRRR